ncbi:MAG: hypothetical protein QOI98_312 [Solirubrobacteraceae bacterium]|nr:hypothetical protein [Solirubrobacteraceae bacterium]
MNGALEPMVIKGCGEVQEGAGDSRDGDATERGDVLGMKLPRTVNREPALLRTAANAGHVVPSSPAFEKTPRLPG